jgi:NAD(P)-dependent dehydrogenase (short-subunit alcohol dehydrogenase family)
VVFLEEGAKVSLVSRDQANLDAAQQKISEERALAQATARVPMGRLATPGEVADTVAYLASDRASYVTGTIMTMDGAQHPIVV